MQVNKYNGDQQTALSHAAYYGHFEVVKVLIRSGVACNTRSTSLTPVEWAARKGHVDIVKLLLKERDLGDLLEDPLDLARSIVSPSLEKTKENMIEMKRALLDILKDRTSPETQPKKL